MLTLWQSSFKETSMNLTNVSECGRCFEKKQQEIHFMVGSSPVTRCSRVWQYRDRGGISSSLEVSSAVVESFLDFFILRTACTN
jgi:hypothetical protein